ncbi:MAG: AMP-binding protein, partial [Mycobacterium leprae]
PSGRSRTRAATRGKTPHRARSQRLLVKPGRRAEAISNTFLVGQAASAREVVERAGDDTAVLLYTSMTVENPRAAELTHDNLRLNAQITARTLAYLTSNDVVLAALPLFHSFGQSCALNATIASGATLVLLPRFEPETVLEAIDRERVTVLIGSPKIYVDMLQYPEREKYDVTRLRLCMSVGPSALPVEALHSFDATFATTILEGYGLSETSSVTSFNYPNRVRKPGSIGTPIPGVEMRVIDEQGSTRRRGEVGELVILGHNVMKGYWCDPEITTQVMQDGWFHTGYGAHVDEDNYFFSVGRMRGPVIRDGHSVDLKEVENVIYTDPDVRGVAVVGVPDARLGEVFAAAVELKAGRVLDTERLQERIKMNLAAYKCPDHIWVLDELPKSAGGKILRRKVAIELATRLGRGPESHGVSPE